jgi:hypothetical protein
MMFLTLKLNTSQRRSARKRAFWYRRICQPLAFKLPPYTVHAGGLAGSMRAKKRSDYF